MATTFNNILDAVGAYYGTESDLWTRLVTRGAGGLTPSEINALRQVPGVEVTVNNAGEFMGWDFNQPFEGPTNPAGSINSNVQNPSYGSSGSFNAKVNGTVIEETGGVKTMTSGAKTVATGAKVSTVASKLNIAVAAVGIAAQLGATIDATLYHAGNFFGLHPPEELNPATWDTLATTEAGKTLIRALFGIDETLGTTTMYLNKDLIDYMYQYWLNEGMFSTGDSELSEPLDGTGVTNFNEWQTPSSYTYTQPFYFIETQAFQYIRIDGNNTRIYYLTFDYPVKIVCRQPGTGSTAEKFDNIYVGYFSDQPGNTLHYTSYKVSDGSQYNTGTRSFSTKTKLDGGNFYVYSEYLYSIDRPTWTLPSSGNIIGSWHSPPGAEQAQWIMDHGRFAQQDPIEGVGKDPTATQIDPAQVPAGTSVVDAYPQIFTNPIKEDVLQPDGTTKEIVYYPIPWVNVPNGMDTPITGTKTQVDPAMDSTAPASELTPLVDVITNPQPQTETPTPGGPATPPDTGTGDSPSTILPSGSASSLWAVYNPTQAQLDSFGSWLWSSNLVEQIKKLFSDPMQAIIGVHKVFATPSTGAAQNIKCGYIDSGVPAAVVTDQYTTIDCGTVDLREYFGNAFDYSPFTEVSLYLPFIGIVQLDVSDVMRGSVSVTYHVDVITGACLADVYIERDAAGGVLYQYSGSAIVTYPVSSGSYASAVTGVLSIGAGIAGTIATGGALAPALIGGAAGLGKLHSNVQKSGSFSGAPGAMGCKIPYIIVSRPQINLPDDFTWYEGKPANDTVLIGSCSGYIRVKETHLENIPATKDELTEIERLLKSGVIV